MKKLMLFSVVSVVSVSVMAITPTPAEMRGPFPILSIPYHENGEVDYEVLAKEAQWVDDNGCPGVIWGQSNDSIDLLTTEEKVRGFEVCAKAVEGRKITLALGANGTNVASMLEMAAEIERVASRHPNARIAMISRPPDTCVTEDAIEEAWDALGKIARRPVIFQTFGTTNTPNPSVELMVRLAKRYPGAYGYVKEEAAGYEANERMERESAAKPVMKTIFAGWGGWQLLHQIRHCGCEGLVTERCAYAPILGELWRRWSRGERGVELTSAFAMYRLLVDQRNYPIGGMRGYALYLLMKEGVFKNMVSRQYNDAKITEGGSFGSGKGWKLEKTVDLKPQQKAELDLLLKDMYDFVKQSAPVTESDELMVGAVNCGAFHYGTTSVTEGEYSAGWDGLVKDWPADVFFYEDVGKSEFPAGSVGKGGLDIRAALGAGEEELSVVDLPRSMMIDGDERKTSRYRALRIVRRWKGRRIAFYGVHLVAEGHIKGPKPAKGEFSASQQLRQLQFAALIEDARQFDFSVFAGDFNAQEIGEYEIFTRSGFRIANGSEKFGVTPTLRKIPADNIIVSSGLDFADFVVPYWYRLNTDHYPVIAKIRLSEEIAKVHIPTVAEYLELPRDERRKWFANGEFRRKMFKANYPDGDGLLSRWVKVEKIPNLRDVGGLPTVDGKTMKRGVLYRSAGWNDNSETPKDKPKSKWKVGKGRLTQKGKEQVAKLGIRTDLDLRAPKECWGLTESPIGSSVQWVNISFGHYEALFKNPECKKAVKEVFDVLAKKENYPIVFHCIGGADRTGCLATILQMLCGVDEDTCLKDWELTGCYTARMNLVHSGGMDGFIALLRKYPGSTTEAKVRAYLLDCGVGAEQIEAVRAILR